jgi:hypothetical protein
MFPLPPYVICAILAPTLAFAEAAAFPWTLPGPTHFAPAIDHWSPAPTAAPRFGNAALFAREASDNTCGYVSGLTGMDVDAVHAHD